MSFFDKARVRFPAWFLAQMGASAWQQHRFRPSPPRVTPW